MSNFIQIHPPKADRNEKLSNSIYSLKADCLILIENEMEKLFASQKLLSPEKCSVLHYATADLFIVVGNFRMSRQKSQLRIAAVDVVT